MSQASEEKLKQFWSIIGFYFTPRKHDVDTFFRIYHWEAGNCIHSITTERASKCYFSFCIHLNIFSFIQTYTKTNFSLPFKACTFIAKAIDWNMKQLGLQPKCFFIFSNRDFFEDDICSDFWDDWKYRALHFCIHIVIAVYNQHTICLRYKMVNRISNYYRYCKTCNATAVVVCRDCCRDWR